jgi:D-alanyl-D-alanine-carboxypeptidase/D-alanyl-D-alanine-endopeptidase
MSFLGTSRALRALVASAALLLAGAGAASADDRLLQEVIALEAQLTFLNMNVPGMIVAAVRDRDSIVLGFGERAEGTGPPDGDTVIGVGSLSKAFTGQMLATIVADSMGVHLTDRLDQRLGWTVPERDGRAITLLDLATHGAGLPREVERKRDPARPDWVSRETYQAALAKEKLLFTPGSGLLYSNYGFDLLSEALGKLYNRPYGAILKERILDRLGLVDTKLTLGENDRQRLFQGYGPDGKAIPRTDLSEIQAGASGVYSTANDMVRWLRWHLDRGSPQGAEVRAIDHAAWVPRDGRNPVAGLDEGAQMSAMGLGWVILAPQGNRPLILQKTGGRQGILSYIAFSPARGVGVFASLNKFDFPAAFAMIAMANHLIEELAPR